VPLHHGPHSLTEVRCADKGGLRGDLHLEGEGQRRFGGGIEYSLGNADGDGELAMRGN
jgi:hypothetical protein